MYRPTINFKKILIHPEEEPNIDELNSIAINAKNDIEYLDNFLTDAAQKYNKLLETTKIEIENIKETLKAEKERQQDINILCNKYTNFTSILNLDANKFIGNLTWNKNVLQAKTQMSKKTKYKVVDVSGNGYEGNNYVYQDNIFLNKIIDAKNPNNISDNNLATSYEYSRITTNNDIKNVPSVFNKDSIEAECVLTIEADNYFNHIEIHTERTDLVLKEIHSSLDGLTYHLEKEYNIPINDKTEIYNDSNYIYGSGIITVNTTKYAKLVFCSNGYSNDTLAFIKVFSDNAKSSNNSIIKKVITVPAARRHVIKLNEIALYENSYTRGSVITKELITNSIKCIALYCNEYINNDYSIENNVSYFLIINGHEYEITPINSQRKGKKIIRTSSQIYKSEQIIYLNEDIKSAKLKIVIKTTNSSITPYISDIKILIGGE